MATRTEIDQSYGTDPQFFGLWLDSRMNYSCARYEDTRHFSDDFDLAQDNKLRHLSRMAGVNAETCSVLDIGCGWGANLEYQACVNSVPEVHGITLCQQQYEHCVGRGLPNTHVQCVDYLDYEPERPLDAAFSICMIEHIVRPEQARGGQQRRIYHDFFRRVHSWTTPGSFFALQSGTRCRLPRGGRIWRISATSIGSSFQAR